MSSTVSPAPVFRPGWGPFGLAFGALPLPLAISSFLPSGVMRTEVGYQPVGINPSARLRPGMATSKTATVLLLALATNKVFSSGERARLFGVEPGGQSGKSAGQTVSTGRPVSVLMMVTVF